MRVISTYYLSPLPPITLALPSPSTLSQMTKENALNWLRLAQIHIYTFSKPTWRGEFEYIILKFFFCVKSWQGCFLTLVRHHVFIILALHHIFNRDSSPITSQVDWVAWKITFARHHRENVNTQQLQLHKYTHNQRKVNFHFISQSRLHSCCYKSNET